MKKNKKGNIKLLLYLIIFFVKKNFISFISKKPNFFDKLI